MHLMSRRFQKSSSISGVTLAVMVHEVGPKWELARSTRVSDGGSGIGPWYRFNGRFW